MVMSESDTALHAYSLSNSKQSVLLISAQRHSRLSYLYGIKIDRVNS